MSDAPTRAPRAARPAPASRRPEIGRIIAVSGANAMMALERDAAPGPQAAAHQPQIGDLVRLDTAAGAAFGVVSSLYAEGDRAAERWVAEIELMGEVARGADGREGSFRRGLSAYPALGARVRAASRQDLERAYRFAGGGAAAPIGALHQDPSIEVSVRIDEMLGKHFAVLGATGTGKSCAVALLLRQILTLCPFAHVLLLDAHGEYAAAFPDSAEVITHRDLRLPFWLLTHEELSEVLMGDRDDYALEIELLGDLVRQAKAMFATWPEDDSRAAHAARRHRRAVDISAFSADTPTRYRMSDLLALIDERMGSLEHQAAISIHRRLRGRLDARLRDHRYDFMFGPEAAETELAAVISRLFRLPVAGKPLAILELSGLPSEVLSVMISVTARLAFDFAIRSGGAAPLTLVCEEAHKYIPVDPSQGFAPARRSIARIAKEGRKYGACLGIVSQRPSELDPTILSQCNTVFALRLSNELDQQLARSAVSDAAAGLMRFLPSLATGEAIAFGDGVALPLRLTFKRLAPEQQPGGGAPLFSESWAEDDRDARFVHEVATRWRLNEAPDPASGPRRAGLGPLGGAGTPRRGDPGGWGRPER